MSYKTRYPSSSIINHISHSSCQSFIMPIINHASHLSFQSFIMSGHPSNQSSCHLSCHSFRYCLFCVLCAAGLSCVLWSPLGCCLSWCVLVCPGVSWSVLVCPGVSWCVLVCPGLSCGL